jgi:hypothetical protein
MELQQIYQQNTGAKFITMIQFADLMNKLAIKIEMSLTELVE